MNLKTVSNGTVEEIRGDHARVKTEDGKNIQIHLPGGRIGQKIKLTIELLSEK